jgi:SAM-dependent methyltransferase
MRSAAASSVASERERWEAAASPLLVDPRDALWRAHCDKVNAEHFARRIPRVPGGVVLKTDLWDEAMGEGLHPLLAGDGRRVVGIDLVPAIATAAHGRHADLHAFAGDVRALPFADAAFDVIVSNSTLDHFATRAEIAVALRELHRVLRPGGTLLLTLDNLANPVVALRNALPFTLLKRLGVVAYPIGAAYGPHGLERAVRDAGFAVDETSTLLHCPRLPAVVVARQARRDGTPARRARLLSRLAGWERLARWPTRYLTGYYVAITARRSEA